MSTYEILSLIAEYSALIVSVVALIVTILGTKK